MTNELKAQIAVVAEYDGWKYQHPIDGLPDGYFEKKPPLLPMLNYLHDKFTYHLSIDTIAPVAKKVLHDLDILSTKLTEQLRNMPFREAIENPNKDLALNRCERRITVIKQAGGTFDPLQIFNAVHAGIVLLREYHKSK